MSERAELSARGLRAPRAEHAAEPLSRSTQRLDPDPGIGPLALFLDLDGTLLDITRTPSDIAAPPGLVPLLVRLSSLLDGALAIVTGRPIAVIDSVLSPLRLTAAGVHGAELRIAPDAPVVALTPRLPPEVAERIQRSIARVDGIHIEKKQFALAVHYREANISAGALAAMLVDALENEPGITLRPGRKVIEIIADTVSKGRALAQLMREPVFSGRRPLMIGDDLTDQSAFAAATARAGAGFRVAGEHFPPHEAELTGPSGVRAWLSGLADQLEAERSAADRLRKD